ncbi:hypothetical protein [Haloferula sp. A504]|uniref:hypothetical protein n=1 Tax=Haloferula sp. A504 TaxID=3373601 RepID=UPI0031C2AFE8|nr:hypothetical protein [Verrucomicrobiaceae bacterium E54]
MKTKNLFVFVFTGLAGLANAATIVTPTSASSTTGLSGRTMTEAINGSLLTSTDPNVLNWTHGAADASSGDYWLSGNGAATSGTEEITFTFSSPVTVGTIYIWNYHRDNTNWDDRALGSFDMEFTFDGGGTNTITGFQLSDIRTATLGEFIPTEALGFAAQNNVTSIKLTNLQNLHQVYGSGAPDSDSDYLGVGEIRFDTATIPEPATGVFAAFALSLGLLRRRR